MSLSGLVSFIQTRCAPRSRRHRPRAVVETAMSARTDVVVHPGQGLPFGRATCSGPRKEGFMLAKVRAAPAALAYWTGLAARSRLRSAHILANHCPLLLVAGAH